MCTVRRVAPPSIRRLSEVVAVVVVVAVMGQYGGELTATNKFCRHRRRIFPVSSCTLISRDGDGAIGAAAVSLEIRSSFSIIHCGTTSRRYEAMAERCNFLPNHNNYRCAASRAALISRRQSSLLHLFSAFPHPSLLDFLVNPLLSD